MGEAPRAKAREARNYNPVRMGVIREPHDLRDAHATKTKTLELEHGTHFGIDTTNSFLLLYVWPVFVKFSTNRGRPIFAHFVAMSTGL